MDISTHFGLKKIVLGSRFGQDKLKDQVLTVLDQKDTIKANVFTD